MVKKHLIFILLNLWILDESNWDESINWQFSMASNLYDVFSDRIKHFKF